MRGFPDTDLVIARLADGQWGIVHRRQLLAAGVGPDAIDRRLRSGRLRRIHRGVYAVGHRHLRPEAYRLAAVLACGRGALLSHAAAAHHLGLRPSRATMIDVSIPYTTPRAHPGIRVHRRAALLPEECGEHDGVPVTTPARTLLDLAATFPRRTVERALDQAEMLELFDLATLERVVGAHPRRPGTPLLASLLREYTAGDALTRSALEDAFLALCDDHGIARPRINAIVCGLEVDFHWPRRRLVVEVDGWAYHRTRRAFERDRERDAVLAAGGIRVLRFTHRQVSREPALVAAALRRR